MVLLGAGAARAADVEFYATVDKEELSINDTLTLAVTIDSGGREPQDLRLPEAPDFEVISRHQSQQTSFSMSPGGGPPTFKQVRVYRMILSPLRTGTFVIQPGQMRVDGKVVKTGAIRVRVVPQQTPPPQAKTPPQGQPPTGFPPGFPPDLFGDGDEEAEDPLGQLFGGAQQPTGDSDLYLRTSLDKKQAWLGEQVTLSVYLFSRVDVSGVEGFKMPKLDGFWSEDIETPNQITGELKMIDGVPYRVFLLRKRALFPLKPGKLTIDPVEVDVSTGFALVLSGRKVHRASAPLTLDVQPHPPGAPPGFEPANVGQWKLSMEATATQVELGQPLTLRVVLEGTGNINGVSVPRLPAIPGVRAYDPTTSDKVSVQRGKVGGRRTLEYLLMPERTGEFELPALSFTYFDPAKGEYRTANTQPIPVRVEAGAGRAATG
ncbi:MAG: BatD family protein, partial [Myxococcales bacterium]